MRTLITSKFVLGLLVLFLVFSKINFVCAEDTWVYIRPDGVVEGTDQIDVDDNVYTFIGDIIVGDSDSVDMYVERDNIVIDGAGFSFQGFEDGAGILLMDRTNITIKNLFGSVFFSNCSNCVITRIQGRVLLENSCNNTIIESKLIHDNRPGLKIVYSHNNTVQRNCVIGNEQGINVISSENNTISENTIANNTVYGLGLWDGSNQNIIIKNNFINNTKHADDLESFQNVWDNGSQGNYWDTYNGTDVDGNGIGDTSFVVPSALINDQTINIDNFPLMNPFHVEPIVIPEFPAWIILPLLLVVTLIGVIIRNKIRKNEET